MRIGSRPHRKIIFAPLVAVVFASIYGADRAKAQAPAAPPQLLPTAQSANTSSWPAAHQDPSPVQPAGGLQANEPVGERSATAQANPIALTSAMQPANAGYAQEGYTQRGSQDAPGVPEYDPNDHRYSEPTPEFVFDPNYFDAPWGGAHQLPDYAPPGYEPRDYQSAPGEPEFTHISPPVPVTQDERQKFVVAGIMPGSFLAPGTNTSFRFRGFVRLAALYNFDPIGSRDSFVPNSIPVPQQVGQNYNMSARMSRFAMETWTPTDWCDRTVHTLIEGDFFNGPDQAVGGGGNPFRLRHAFFDIGWFRLGQQNTVFMDGSNWPSLVDFQGPNGWINQRQPSARMTVPLAERLFWATSVERPFSDIATNGLGEGVQDVPDFATHLRLEGNVGHLQASALVRTLGYRPTGGDVTRLTGSGFSGSAVVHPWAIALGTDPVHDENPSGLTRSRILLQWTRGAGISRYINDLAGQQMDGQVNPITGEFETVNATGWNASYENWFSERWLTNFTYSEVNADNNAGQPGNTYSAGKYLAGSLWWIPVTRMSFGVEYIWGERENLDGEGARARRLNGMFQYNF